MRKRARKNDGIEVATRAVLAVGPLLNPMKRDPQWLVELRNSVPWRAERRMEYEISGDLRISPGRHKPQDRPLLAAARARQREADAWIQRVRARKAAKP